MRSWEKNVRKVVPYVPGEQPREENVIKLNTNENPYPPAPGVKRALEQLRAENLKKYPDPTASELVGALARRYSVKPEQVFVGVGSDDVLAMAFLTFFNSEKPVLFPDITYSFYDVWAELFRIPYEQIPLNDRFQICPEQYFSADHPNGGVIFPNPNAPTGLELEPDAVERIVRENPDVVVIVDEAYVDFGAKSALPLVEKYDNLLVVQTFSKSRSMAGARLGYAIGCPALIRDLATIQFSTNPYNVSRMALRAGEQALAEQAYFDDNCRKIQETRAYTKAALEALGFFCTDSRANFLFARHPRLAGEALYRGLKERGVLVRWFDSPRIRDFNRITIGTRPQMDLLLEKVRELL